MANQHKELVKNKETKVLPLNILNTTDQKGIGINLKAEPTQRTDEREQSSRKPPVSAEEVLSLNNLSPISQIAPFSFESFIETLQVALVAKLRKLPV